MLPDLSVTSENRLMNNVEALNFANKSDKNNYEVELYTSLISWCHAAEIKKKNFLTGSNWRLTPISVLPSSRTGETRSDQNLCKGGEASLILFGSLGTTHTMTFFSKCAHVSFSRNRVTQHPIIPQSAILQSGGAAGNDSCSF